MAKKKVTEAEKEIAEVTPAVGDSVIYEAGTPEAPEQWGAVILALDPDGRADLEVTNGS